MGVVGLVLENIRLLLKSSCTLAGSWSLIGRFLVARGRLWQICIFGAPFCMLWAVCHKLSFGPWCGLPMPGSSAERSIQQAGSFILVNRKPTCVGAPLDRGEQVLCIVCASAFIKGRKVFDFLLG